MAQLGRRDAAVADCPSAKNTFITLAAFGEKRFRVPGPSTNTETDLGASEANKKVCKAPRTCAGT